MSELTYTIIRFSLLLLLWFFILSLAAVLRRDIYGTRVSRLTRRERRATSARLPVAAGSSAPPATQPSRRRLPTTLVVTDGQLAGTSVPLGRQGVLIGRSPECTLVLDDEYSSSRHARIFPTPDGWMVEDLGSRNGTLVGGSPITGPTPVEQGSVVRIGQTSLELRD